VDAVLDKLLWADENRIAICRSVRDHENIAYYRYMDAMDDMLSDVMDTSVARVAWVYYDRYTHPAMASFAIEVG
jgi:hypothetical protein